MADQKISASTAKGTPVDADYLPIVDTVAGDNKKVLWSAIKATLKTYFDAIYGTPVSDETLGGTTINRTLAHTPIAGTLTVYDGTVKLTVAVDFTQTGTAVTFFVAPDAPTASYRYA